MVQVDCQMCKKKPADMRLLKHTEYNCPIFVCADCAEKRRISIQKSNHVSVCSNNEHLASSSI